MICASRITHPAFTFHSSRFPFKNMRHHVRSTAADVLRHGDGGIFDLILSGQAARIVIEASTIWYMPVARHRMAARLQAAHRADRQSAAEEDVAVEAQARAFARFGKAAGFQTDHGGDREGIVDFKEVDVGVVNLA